ncbi:MAG: TolC family protein, partial [Bacteroidales bacterium]
PVVEIDTGSSIGRPEVKLFESQLSQLEKSGNLLRSNRFPKIFFFGQAGYGRPGLNMLNDTFEPYYLVGARISWNPFDWKVNRRQQQVLDLQHKQLNNQLDAFNLSIETELEKYRSDIQKYEELIRSDDELIELRSNIVETSTSKFDNGIINSADYLSCLNEEKQARLNREVHRIKMVQAKADYLVIKGN